MFFLLSGLLTGLPSISTSPDVLSYAFDNIRNKVDLPAPFIPTSPKIVWLGIVKFKSLSTILLPNDFVSPL